MDERNYDLGIILELNNNYVLGRIIDTDEPFKIPLRREFLNNLSEYMVVAVNLDHTDFIYQ